MKCSEIAPLLDRFLQGKLSPSEEKTIEKHLETCSPCQEKLDQLLAANDTPPPGKKEEQRHSDETQEITAQKQQQILRRAKYKSRFSMALFLLALFLLMHIVGTLVSSLFYSWGGENSKLYRTQRTAVILVEHTFPNVTIPLRPSPSQRFSSRVGWGHSSLEIKPYMAALGSYAMQKQVGRERQIIGTLNINHFLGMTATQWNWVGGTHNHYLFFYHPQAFKSIAPDDEANMALVSQEGWQVLEDLPQGTVAELAISFKELHSIQEVMAMLAEYDLEILWYAVSTGQEGQKNNRESLRPMSTFDGVWGFAHMSTNLLNFSAPISSQDSAIREEYFMNNMEFLLNNESLAKKLYRGNPNELLLQKRFAYLQENGIQVYGLVVTGPSKELLKLKELEGVHSPAVGDVQLWNWFHRSFQGTLY